MNDAEEVEAYASAAAQAYLDGVDNTLVEQALSLGVTGGWLLDIGTGPGAIPLKLARQLRALRAVGLDCSRNMVRAARRAAMESGLNERALFFVGDAYHLAFPDGWFDFVLSNSLLHHLADPVAALDEMVRVAKPSGVILLRDLRRPSRLLFPLHVRWYGRHYSRLMRNLYEDSVRAAYSGEELRDLLHRSSLSRARVFFHGRTHLGFFRNGRRGGMASQADPVPATGGA